MSRGACLLRKARSPRGDIETDEWPAKPLASTAIVFLLRLGQTYKSGHLATPLVVVTDGPTGSGETKA